MTWMIGIHGLKQRGLWKEMPLIPLWDAAAFGIWLTSFLRNSIRWRGADYYHSGRQAGAGGPGAPLGQRSALAVNQDHSRQHNQRAGGAAQR